MPYSYSNPDHSIVTDGNGTFWRASDLDRLPEGLVPLPYVAPDAGPVAVVTARQIRLALQRSGLLPAASTWIESADEATRIEWEYATEVRRDHPMWTVAAAALGRTAGDIDALFAQAATL